MEYQVKDGVILSEEGIPYGPRWASDGRLSFEYQEEGIGRVHYYNPVSGAGGHVVFLKRHWDGFRLYLERGGVTFSPPYRAVRLYPYGCEAEWGLGDDRFLYGVYAADECILFRLRTPDTIAAETGAKLELYENFALVPGDAGDPRIPNHGKRRRWKEWSWDGGKNALSGGYCETSDSAPGNTAELLIRISANRALRHEVKPRNRKRLLRFEALKPGQEYLILISFGDGAAEDKKAGRAEELLLAQKLRYQGVAEKSPVLRSGYPALDHFFSLAPQYHESMKVLDVPGAIKASNASYWVWGWDGMTCGAAAAYWGDAAHIEGMLAFYEKTADPEKGIIHEFHNDLSGASVCPAPAQGMYLCLLYLYWSVTGDEETLRRRYPFARTLYRRMKERQTGDGFCEGTSLFPDYPELMDETGRDLSTFNNSVYYCALRAMEAIASQLGDHETASEAERDGKRLRAAFQKRLFDGQRGFYASSADAETGRRRDVITLCALKWENDFYQELLEGTEEACLRFVRENLMGTHGLRDIPLWNRAFDADANQLHCWWPVHSETFVRLANRCNAPDLTARFVGYLEYWLERLCCPEGISYYAEPGGQFDTWNCLCGAWQAYTIRGWYQAIVHGILGVTLDHNGITISPCSGGEMEIEGLHYRGRRISVQMRGSGAFAEKIEVGGRILNGSNVIPESWLEGERVSIRVCRTEREPDLFFLERISGGRLLDYSRTDGRMNAVIQTEAAAEAIFYTPRGLDISVGSGRPCTELLSGQNRLRVRLEGGGRYELSVCAAGDARSL